MADLGPFRVTYETEPILCGRDCVLSENSRPFDFNGGRYIYTSTWPATTAIAWRTESDIRLAFHEGGNRFELGPTIRAGSGVKGGFDECAAHNVNVVVDNGKIYLVYVGSAAPDGNTRTIGLLIGDTPEGPFEPVGRNPLGPASWEGHDPNWRSGGVMGDPILVKDPDGKFRLFYKAGGAGRPIAEMCVAVADSVEGPYVPSAWNPLIHASHPYESWSVFISEGKWYCLADYPQGKSTRTDLFESVDGYAWELIQAEALSVRHLPDQLVARLPGSHAYLVATAVETEGEGGEPVGLTFAVLGRTDDWIRFGFLGYAGMERAT